MVLYIGIERQHKSKHDRCQTGRRIMHFGNKVYVVTGAASCLLACATLALMLGAAPAAAAVEQCRFIQAKPEREACYQRQATALAAKRKPEPIGPTADSKTFESLEQMKHEDEALNRQLHSICRGC
jgi:hypothetical protein